MPEATSVTRALIIHPVESTRGEIARMLRPAAGTPITVQEAESLTEGLRAARWFDPRYVLLTLHTEML